MPYGVMDYQNVACRHIMADIIGVGEHKFSLTERLVFIGLNLTYELPNCTEYTVQNDEIMHHSLFLF